MQAKADELLRPLHAALDGLAAREAATAGGFLEERAGAKVDLCASVMLEKLVLSWGARRPARGLRSAWASTR